MTKEFTLHADVANQIHKYFGSPGWTDHELSFLELESIRSAKKRKRFLHRTKRHVRVHPSGTL